MFVLSINVPNNKTCDLSKACWSPDGGELLHGRDDLLLIERELVKILELRSQENLRPNAFDGSRERSLQYSLPIGLVEIDQELEQIVEKLVIDLDRYLKISSVWSSVPDRKRLPLCETLCRAAVSTLRKRRSRHRGPRRCSFLFPPNISGPGPTSESDTRAPPEIFCTLSFQRFSYEIPATLRLSHALRDRRPISVNNSSSV